MVRFVILILSIFSSTLTCASAQNVTVTAPLPDKSGDGHVTVSRMAAQLGVSKGTVLTRCGTTLVYVGPKSVCPSLAAATIADPYEIHPSVAPRDVTPIAAGAHKLKDAVIRAPTVTNAPKDFGSSGQISYGSAKGIHALQAMDAFPLRAGGDVIEDVIADQVRTFVTPEKGKATTLNDVTINRVVVGTHKRGIYLRGDSARWDIGNFRISYNGPANSPGDIPMGIQLAMNGSETVHDVTVHDGDIGGFINQSPASYPNADGMDCERGVHNVTVRRVTFHDNTDGGFDCKATGVVLDQVTSARNGRNFRLWGSGTATTITSIDPRKDHIWMGAGSNYTIAKLIAVGSGVLIETADQTATVTVLSCDLTGWTGSVRTKGPGKVTLAKGCTR